jgi:hypothetical protein
MGLKDPDWGPQTRMTKGPFPAKRRNRGIDPSDWDLAPAGAWFCPQCDFLKLSRCTYRGHRSLRASDPNARRIAKALRRGAKERLCANPECESPFLPLHDRQKYCCDAHRERAKYLRRRSAPGGK